MRIALRAAAAVGPADSEAAAKPPKAGGKVRTRSASNTQHAKRVDGEFLAAVAPDGTVLEMFGARADHGLAMIADDGKVCLAWHQSNVGKIWRTVRRRSANRGSRTPASWLPAA